MDKIRIKFKDAYQDILISPIDWDFLKDKKLYINKRGYVKIIIDKRAYRLHRVLLNAETGEYVDHINRNILDNRRENLRICSPSENNRNTRPHKKNKSGYKGVIDVSKYNKNPTWVAQICKNGKRKHLGTFNSPVDAARAYDRAAKKYFGEFGFLNNV